MFWASRFGRFTPSRRAIRSITFAAVGGFGGSAAIPLAKTRTLERNRAFAVGEMVDNVLH